MSINMSPYYATQEAFRNELQQGESLLWSGQPDPNKWFVKEDIFALPFSILWLGFALFWEWGALTPLRMHEKFSSHGAPDAFTYFPYIFPLFGLPFVFIGLYMVFGRIIVRRWTRKRTFYAVTDKRVMVLVRSFRGSNLRSKSIADIDDINKSADASGRGTVTFGPAAGMGNTPAWAANMATSMNWGPGRSQMMSMLPLAFEDIPDAARVYELVSSKKLAQTSEKSSY
jgi:hypothetical protein